MQNTRLNTEEAELIHGYRLLTTSQRELILAAVLCTSTTVTHPAIHLAYERKEPVAALP